MTNAVARLTSALADRYTIERELGSGGMATPTTPPEKAQLKSLRRLWYEKRITATDIQQSKELQLKELAEKYILTTNLPPWEGVWKNRW